MPRKLSSTVGLSHAHDRFSSVAIRYKIADFGWDFQSFMILIDVTIHDWQSQKGGIDDGLLLSI